MPDRARLAFAAVAAVLVAALAVGAYFAFFSGGDGAEPPRPANGRYENSKLRYRFEYPAGWQDLTDRIPFVVPKETKVDDVAVVGTLESGVEVFNGVQVSVVRIDHKVKAPDLEKELSALDEVYKQQAAAISGRLRDPEWVELGGLMARQYITEFAYGSSRGVPLFEVASSSVVTFFEDRQYTVNCQGRASTFDSAVLTGCEQVLQSFRFK